MSRAEQWWIGKAVRSDADGLTAPDETLPSDDARSPIRSEQVAFVSARELGRVRRIALALPEVNERTSHREPCFFVRDRRPLCYYHDDHNGDGRISLWCPAAPGVQEEMVTAEPLRFFAPPTSANGVFSGWLGTYLDTSGGNTLDWSEIGAIIEDAYRHVAPQALVATLDERSR
jgi:hypothetical protein